MSFDPFAKVKIKSKKKRTLSSRRWLERHLNDPFVRQAKVEGYRARSAFKLDEIQEKYKIFKKGQFVVDLGAAPGGWSQVALQHLGESGHVFGIDLLPIDPMFGATFIEGDFTDDQVYADLRQMIGERKIDVVLSDMAPSTSGIRNLDHMRIVHLVDLAYDFVTLYLKQNGVFVSKVFQGGADHQLLTKLKQDFVKVSHFKPKSSRPESPEMYLVASGKRK